MAVKPIETVYKGYRFRSRLEARWAVFFDAAGIQYRYETEGFKTESGDMYLPDFYLPEYRMYAEVKGDEEQYRNDLPRIIKFLDGFDAPIKRLIVLGNIPYSKESDGIYWFPVMYYHPLDESVTREYKTVIWFDGCDAAYFVLDRKTRCSDRTREKYRSRPMVAREKGCVGTIPYEKLDPIPDVEMISDSDFDDFNFALRYDFKSERLIEAYRKARQARFEHGDTPT